MQIWLQPCWQHWNSQPHLLRKLRPHAETASKREHCRLALTQIVTTVGILLKWNSWKQEQENNLKKFWKKLQNWLWSWCTPREHLEISLWKAAVWGRRERHHHANGEGKEKPVRGKQATLPLLPSFPKGRGRASFIARADGMYTTPLSDPVQGALAFVTAQSGS